MRSVFGLPMGELWIPREWPRLKSYINGERVYRKEKVKR